MTFEILSGVPRTKQKSKLGGRSIHTQSIPFPLCLNFTQITRTTNRVRVTKELQKATTSSETSAMTYPSKEYQAGSTGAVPFLVPWMPLPSPPFQQEGPSRSRNRGYQDHNNYVLAALEAALDLADRKAYLVALCDLEQRTGKNQHRPTNKNEGQEIKQ
jgi:hypothetical protein